VGASSPPTASHTVETYIARLRRILRDGFASGILLTRPPGYVLDVEPRHVDAFRFEELLKDGTAAAERDDPEQASALLRTALALWRGQALADVADAPFARVAARRLNDQHRHQWLQWTLPHRGHRELTAAHRSGHPHRYLLRHRLLKCLGDGPERVTLQCCGHQELRHGHPRAGGRFGPLRAGRQPVYQHRVHRQWLPARVDVNLHGHPPLRTGVTAASQWAGSRLRAPPR
jgi:hypothetical protein